MHKRLSVQAKTKFEIRTCRRAFRTWRTNRLIVTLRKFPLVGRFMRKNYSGSRGKAVFGVLWSMLRVLGHLVGISAYFYTLAYIANFLGFPGLYSMYVYGSVLVGSWTSAALIPSLDGMERMALRDLHMPGSSFFLQRMRENYGLFAVKHAFAWAVVPHLLPDMAPSAFPGFGLLFMALGARMLVDDLQMRHYIRNRTMHRPAWQTVVRVALLLALAAPFNYAVVHWVGPLSGEALRMLSIGLFASGMILFLAGMMAERSVLRRGDLDGYGKEMIREMGKTSEQLGEATRRQQRAQLQKQILREATASKTGLAGLHECFFRRFGKVLRKALWIRCGIAAVFCAVAFGGVLLSGRPDYIFRAKGVVLYLIVLFTYSEAFCKLAFEQIDTALLGYGFMRTPEMILQAFWIRLRKMFRMNLPFFLLMVLPEVVYCAMNGLWVELCLDLSVYLSVQVYMIVSTLGMLYLLQPYSRTMKVTSFWRTIPQSIAPFFAYVLFQHPNLSKTAVAAIAICTLAFTVIILALVRLKAPKTFRLRLS